jgi:CelD/BcsL family acetyltransferase involved in cellulose biosynthesis
MLTTPRPADSPDRRRRHPAAAGDAGAFRIPEEDLPGDQREVVWTNEVDLLAGHRDAWQRLSETALDENPFFGPELLLPALAEFREAGLQVALVFAESRKWPAGPRVLCGLVPLVIRRHFRGLPVRTAEIWSHVHCYLGTPLIRTSGAQATWQALIDALRGEPARASLLCLPRVGADGAFHYFLADCWTEQPVTHEQLELTRRALLVKHSSAAACLARWPRKKRHEVNRLEKRLQQEGSLALRVYQPAEPLEPWLDRFLALEASGWKGRDGGALACEASNARFVRSMAANLAQHGKLELLALEVNQQPVAMKLNVLGRAGAFAFKIAYDEAWARFSPGVLLERRYIELFHQTTNHQDWIDSCATPDHSMINTLWPDRRLLQTLVIATGRRGGDLMTALLPLARWAKRKFKR